MNRRPNVLFLMCDQLRPDIAGYVGNKVIRTPNMDWIAEDAVQFTNAYTPSPVCIPARQSLMSGQLPRTSGCEIFGDDLPPFYRTFARSFTEKAYNTTCCGKLHHNGIDQMQGWLRRYGQDIFIEESFIENMDKEELKKVKIPKDETRWGLLKELRKAGPGHARNTCNDESALQGAKNFIEDTFLSPYYDKHQPNQPVLLKVSFSLPHYPYFCREDLFKYYLNRVPLYDNEKLLGHKYMDFKHIEIGTELSKRDLQRVTAAYYAMIETVDGYIGEVLDKLREVGEDLDDWIIIFTADHGEMLGQHGVWAKHVFYEASARVPLLIRYPKKFGKKTISKNVNLCDLYATLCDLCDVPLPENLDSRTLVPLLNGNTDNWYNESISQNKGYQLMIKYDDYKYQYYGEELKEVLFDLKENPEETINFIDDSRYANIIEKMRKRAGELNFGKFATENYKNAGYNTKIIKTALNCE